jgi:hypothetical protein
MNKAIFVYYPAKQILRTAPWSCTYEAPIGACNSSMVIRSLTSVDQTERIFGEIPPKCSAKATSVGFPSFQPMIPLVAVVFNVFLFFV